MFNIASVNVPHGTWTKLGTSTTNNQELLIRIPSIADKKVIPGVWVALSYQETFTASELVIINPHSIASRVNYMLVAETGSDLSIYVELRSQLPNPVTVQLWRY